MAETSTKLVCQALIAREQLTSHKRTLNKEIAGRERRLSQAIASFARREMDLPLGDDPATLSPELTQLIADPVRGL